MAGKKKKAAIKERKKKQRERRVDKDGRPVSKKRARVEDDEDACDPVEPDEETELVGLEGEGRFYLVDADRRVVYESERDVFDRLVEAGAWDPARRELVRSDGSRLTLGSEARDASAASAPAPAAPAEVAVVARARAGPRLSKAARKQEKKAKVAEVDAKAKADEAADAAAKREREKAKQRPKKKRRR